ncbi:hypothetical protein [Paenibacillus alkaliterrae]|nr:hypothetical protein [Paenibacillus alkaliterrae]
MNRYLMSLVSDKMAVLCMGIIALVVAAGIGAPGWRQTIPLR